jgi:Na+/pantothenate symporter
MTIGSPIIQSLMLKCLNNSCMLYSKSLMLKCLMTIGSLIMTILMLKCFMIQHKPEIMLPDFQLEPDYPISLRKRLGMRCGFIFFSDSFKYCDLILRKHEPDTFRKIVLA